MLHVSRVQERQHHPPRFLVTSEPPPPPPRPGAPRRNSRSVVLWIPGSTWSLTPAPTWRCIRNQPGRGREVAASSPSKKEIPQIKDELNGFPGTKEIEMSTLVNSSFSSGTTEAFLFRQPPSINCRVRLRLRDNSTSTRIRSTKVRLTLFY